MKNKFWGGVLFCLTLSACSTDLSVIGDHKETMIVYGLLDQSQPKQYIKVNKAFLGDGNALEYAQAKDSTQYSNQLLVTIKQIHNGTIVHTDTLMPDNTISKDSGVFYGPTQTNVIYSFDTPPGTLDINNQYELTVKNPITGLTASGQTGLVGDATFNSPAPSSPFYGFVLSSNSNYQFPVRWSSGANARVYQLTVRLNYIDSTTTGNNTKSIEWVFPSIETEKLSGGEAMQNDFLGQSFLRFVGNQLSDFNGLLGRRVLTADLILVAGSDDLNTFINVNKPSTSLVQERPEYTNINNGLGIFSSRYNQPPMTKPLAAATLDSLSCGVYTKHLKFLDHTGMLCQ